MNKFKKGDRVRARISAMVPIGSVGTVTTVLENYAYVSVVFDDPEVQGSAAPWSLHDSGLDRIAAPYPTEANESRGANNRPMLLTQDHAERKNTPIATGVMDYFPLALAYVARVSKAGNDQHNPGQPLHWDKTKSKDHADCIARHLIDRGTVDPTDGLSHTGKLAWRALALLETELGNGTE